MKSLTGRTGSRTWAPEFEDLLAGAGCPTCSQGRPDDDGHGLRIHAGELVLRQLRRRDCGRCRFPGCRNRVRLQAHHIRWWEWAAGPTSTTCA